MAGRWARQAAICAIVGVMAIAAAAALDDEPEAATPLPAVKVLKAEPAPQVQTRQFFGRIRARETVDLSFEVGGYLEFLNAIEGERVIRGQRLAALDAAPFERAAERAELELVQAERTFARASSLAARNAASEAQAEDSETARDLAEVALREARDDLADATILAPFDGLVALRLTPVFTNVTEGRPILRVHDMSEVRAEFDLPERLLAQIGNPADVAFSTRLPGRPEPIELRFVEVHAETDQIGQSFTVTLAFPEMEHPLLVPGASVTITAAVAVESNGTVLPASALLAGEDRSVAVMALEDMGDGRARLARLAVDAHSPAGTGFIVDGLAPGTEVVAVGGHLLRPGQVVRRYHGLTVDAP